MDAEQIVTPEEVAAFQAAGREYIKRHPDYSEDLDHAGTPLDKGGLGLDFSAHVTQEIIRAGERGVRLAHYLAKNFDVAHKLMSITNPKRAKEEVQRQLSWIDRHGFGVPEQRIQLSEEDEYRRQRREDFRSGKRHKYR